ncbi:hypothetical protein OAT67_01625 [Bacteriovoracaceae bacterium]|nr:hypothetical protein [Bacteriovoracaceae bacterium]
MKVLSFLIISLISISSFSEGAVGNTRAGEGNTEEMNLTDQDRWESQTYIHEGRAKRLKDEECAKLDDPRTCQGSDPGFKYKGMDSNMVKAISKAYSMILGFTDGSFKAGENAKTETVTTEKTVNDKKVTETTEEKQDQQDYCKYVAMGGEAIAMFQQQAAQQNLVNLDNGNQNSIQKKSLEKAARSHRERSKTAKMQEMTWGATTACYTWYAAQAFMGNIQHSFGLWAKLAGAYLLFDFYGTEKDKQQEYADQVKAIADKLPGPGDCNAITDTDCYCAEKSTMYDPRCMPFVQKRKMANTSYAVPCLDKEMKADVQCQCIDEESCFDSRFFQDINGPGLGNFLNSPIGSQFKALTRGEYQGGRVDTTSGRNTSAIKKAIDDLMDKKGGPADPDLNKDQMEEAKLIASGGIPLGLAKTLASTPFDKNAQKQYAKFKNRFNRPIKYNAKSKKNGPKVLTFSGGSGLRPNKKKTRNNGMDFSKMFNKNKKKKANSNGKVLNFAGEASRQAQISKNTDRPIFDIISRRYRVSGWRRLELK